MKSQQSHQRKKQQTFQSAFLNIFSVIVTTQEQLDTLRQLLNQQISFNLKDLYVLVAGKSTSINYQHVLNFLKQNVNQKDSQNSQNEVNTAIESFIRFYNGNSSLNLSFTQFSSIFLNRQNRLLMKMTLERDSIGTLPNYILNFSRKILYKQIELHFLLIKFRKEWQNQMTILIENFITQENYLDQERLIQIFKNISGSIPQKVNVQFDIFMRYLKPFSSFKVSKQLLNNLLLNTNAENVETFLKQKTKKSKGKVKHGSLEKSKKFIDPFIRPQFHDCLTRPKVTDMFSYRQVKSIEKHFNRINQSTGLVNHEDITMKLKKFETAIEKNCQKVLEAIKDVIWLQKQIEYARVELNLCPDFYPVLFFQCFHKDKHNRIIPSAMQIYFKQFGITIPLNEIYLLFKRYAWFSQGKMDFNAFCSMFDVCQTAYSRIQKNRQIKSLADVDIVTKKNFLILLATIIKNQKKIDNIKGKLQKVKDMNLRDVFACFDTDDDGYLSITDFRVVWKKYFNLEFSKDMIFLLWFRMGYNNQNQLIRYQDFIKQMVPKSNSYIEDKKLKKIKSQKNIKFGTRQSFRKLK